MGKSSKKWKRIDSQKLQDEVKAVQLDREIDENLSSLYSINTTPKALPRSARREIARHGTPKVQATIRKAEKAITRKEKSLPAKRSRTKETRHENVDLWAGEDLPNRSRVRRPNMAPAIITPHPGQSYNPPPEDYKSAVVTAVAKHVTNKAHAAAIELQRSTISAPLLENEILEPEGAEENAGPSEDESANTESFIRRYARRKTMYQRRKKQRFLERERLDAMQSKSRKLLKQIADVSTVVLEVKREEERQKLLRIYKAQLKEIKAQRVREGRASFVRIGKSWWRRPEIAVVLPSDMKYQGLRSLRTRLTAPAARDRAASIYQRALTEPLAAPTPTNVKTARYKSWKRQKMRPFICSLQRQMKNKGTLS